MSFSVIKIYKTDILEDRNMSVDSIDYYLTNYATLYKQINDFQYIKQDKLFNSIKVAINQSELDFVNEFNYVRIENDDSANGRVCYYFIENVEWKSPNTLQLNLKMDLLNTFKLNTDYTLSNFTKISREHKNRYKRIGLTNNFKILVDKYDEGINATKYKNSMKYEFYETYGNNGWCLLYKNNNAIDPDKFNQVNPVSTFLYPNKPLEINYFEGETDIYPACNDEAPDYLVISPKYNTPSNPKGLRFSFRTAYHGTKYFNVYREQLNPNNYYDYCIYCVEGQNEISEMYYVREHYISNTFQSYELLDYVSGTTEEHCLFLEGVISFSSFGTQILKYASKNTYASGAPSTSSSNIGVSYSYEVGHLKLSEAVDKTDSTIIKMLKLPYCPIRQITGRFQRMSLDNTIGHFDEQTGELEIYPNVEYKNTLYNDGDIFNDIITILILNDNASRTEEDTKLHHSAFSYWKFAYDEFYKIIAMEDLNTWNMNILNPEVYFKMTKTINSRFLFHLYNLDNLVLYSQEDYDNIVSVARSLEETIYSNQYINYLRNGYNYDVKNKNRQLIFGALGVGMNALGMGVDLGNQAQSKTGITTLGGIGTVGGLIGGTLNFINNAISAEMQMEQKQQQLKAQATNVSGSDDIDLLEYYNGNKAFMVYYSVNDNMKELVDDLFYYCGYACNRMGQPNISSRIWFNFIQADVVFQTSNIDKSFLQEIATKYANGITFYHKHNNKYDLAQEKENWESDFFS